MFVCVYVCVLVCVIVCVFVLTGTDWENVFAVPVGVSNSIEKASNII